MFVQDKKQERERNAFLEICKGTGTERVPHFTEISNALYIRGKSYENVGLYPRAYGIHILISPVVLITK